MPEELIRVFPDRNEWTPRDEWAFTGDLPLEGMRPGTPDTPVMVSVTFTWWRRRAEQIAESWRTHYRNVRIGGPAYDDPGAEFVPGRFIKQGCTITTRGCPKKCGWCSVPKREGPLRLLPINPGHIVQDNNLLASSLKSHLYSEREARGHFDAVFEMLRQQKRACSFNGGLDKHFLKPWHVAYFDSIPIDELWWAVDEEGDFRYITRVKELFAHVPMRKMRCYTMIGYGDETLAEAERRIERVFNLGFMPFSQLYQPPDAKQPTKIYGADWKAVNRKWSRPAWYMSQGFPQIPQTLLLTEAESQD
jgi:hypothetical protein